MTRTAGECQAASRCRPPGGHCESCFQVRAQFVYYLLFCTLTYCPVFLFGRQINSMVPVQNLIPMWGNSRNWRAQQPNGHLIFHVPTVEFQKNTCLLFLLAWTTLIILHVNFMYHYSKSIPFVKESTGLWVNFFFRGDPSEGVSSDKSLKRDYR